ncbi:MAG: Fur family transcriptional regulator [Sphingomonadaceae bacterium]
MDGLGLTVPKVLRTLQLAGYRATAARRAVIEAVLEKERHFSGAELLAEVAAADRSVGRATVFRTLDVLVELGVLGRVHRPEGGHGYVLCARDHHHHHAICSRCGLVVTLPGCPIDSVAERDAAAAGFRLEGHRLEYYGICLACQGKGDS